jgi:diguanylate cyclase (GGDEF)-like protein/PAS domain S-box-containing protein
VLVGHLPVGVFVTAPDGTVVYVSDRCAEMIGAAPDPDGGWAWRERLHPDDRHKVVEDWTASLGGSSFTATYRVRSPQDADTYRWLQVRADPSFADGTLQAMIGTVEDVTDLRELQRKWGNRQLMLDAVLTNSSDLVIVVDLQGRLSFVSHAAQRMLGHDPQHWMGRDVFELLHPDDVGRAAEAMSNTVTTGPGVKEALELRVRHADGSWRDVEIVANNLSDDEHVGGLVITARDISERLQAQASAAQASDRFEQAFDRAPIGMALIANDGRLLRVNEAMAQMVGRSIKELTGADLFSLAHPDDRETAVERALATLHRGDREPLEVRIVRGDGRIAWARITATVIRDDDGRAQHTIAHIEDVTDQRTLREQLERAAAHDALTGLLNRAGFANRFVEVARRDAHGPGALLIIDLDGFKAVNDQHGHAAGDQLLELIARRLVDTVRVSDLVGRLGGDEFAIYQPDVVDVAMVVALGERVRSVLAAPFRIDAGTVSVSGSVGVAMLDGAVELTRALAAADAASYAAKRSGGDRVELTWCTELSLLPRPT